MILNLILGLLLNQTDDVKKPVVTRWSFENVETVLFEGELSFRASGQNMDVKEWGIFTCKAPELPTQKNVQTKVLVLNAKTAPVPVRDFSPLMRTVYLSRLPVKEAINKDLIDVKHLYHLITKIFLSILILSTKIILLFHWLPPLYLFLQCYFI